MGKIFSPKRIFKFFFLFLSLTLFLFDQKDHSFFRFVPISSSEDFFLEPKDGLKPETEFLIVEASNLKPSFPPALFSQKVFAEMTENASPRKREVIEYEVKKGETIASLAQKFGISQETILWANDLKPNAPLKEGEKLIILPVSGLFHLVEKGETLEKIAKKYQANEEEIIAFNELESPTDILPGDLLIIPNGKMPKETPKPEQKLPRQASSFSSYFICPISPPCTLTQGLHWYNAVDLSHGRCGEPIFAPAMGVVQKAKMGGWNGGAGNYVTILHPEGVVTMYAHLQTIFVKPGEKVSQGQTIGLMGTTGNSTGCHLHFEVRGAKNPFAK